MSSTSIIPHAISACSRSRTRRLYARIGHPATSAASQTTSAAPVQANLIDAGSTVIVPPAAFVAVVVAADHMSIPSPPPTRDMSDRAAANTTPCSHSGEGCRFAASGDDELFSASTYRHFSVVGWFRPSVRVHFVAFRQI